MRGNSHRQLGTLLAEKYLTHLPERSVTLFLLGCIQPDRNPATYLKGSVRELWLRGHHWPNSRRYICKLIARLQKRQHLQPLDCYQLGKLMHYLADAFTYPHNPHFPGTLADHRKYEIVLQQRFLKILPHTTLSPAAPFRDPWAAVCVLHRKYAAHPGDPERDIRYCLRACNTVMALLLQPAQKMSFSG